MSILFCRTGDENMAKNSRKYGKIKRFIVLDGTPRVLSKMKAPTRGAVLTTQLFLGDPRGTSIGGEKISVLITTAGKAYEFPRL
jgi:hypothetical protein